MSNDNYCSMETKDKEALVKAGREYLTILHNRLDQANTYLEDRMKSMVSSTPEDREYYLERSPWFHEHKEQVAVVEKRIDELSRLLARVESLSQKTDYTSSQ